MGGVNSSVYLGFPVEMIEKIEIIRGPGSVLYGTNAFTGVINIITNQNYDKSTFGANVNAGSFGTTGGSVSGVYVKDDFKANVSAKFDKVDGWDYSAVTVHPNPTLDHLPIDMQYGRQNYGLATDVSYKGLSFFGFYSNDNQDVLGVLPYATYAGENKISRWFLNLGYTHNFTDLWQASFNLTHNGSDMKLYDGAVALPYDHQENADYLAELTVNGEPIKNLNLVVGGVVDSRNKNNISSHDAIPKKYDQMHLSGYIQADYRPVELLKLIAGAQFNKPDVGDLDIVPRVGTILNITDELGFKVLYGSAFRSPWPIEQMLVNPAVLGNPDLEPEKISTLDVQLFYSTKKAEGSVTYYNSNYSNSITRAPVSGQPGVVTYVNQGKLHMNGFEFEGKVSLSSNVFVTGSATYQNNVDEKRVSVYIPKYMGKIGAFYKTNFGLTAGVYNTYFGKPKENNGLELNPEAKAVDLLSINLIYKLPLSLPLELSVYGQNLLDNSYHYTEFSRGLVNTLPMQPGRAVYGKISLRF
jgi:outer membrane cobalamin receptor